MADLSKHTTDFSDFLVIRNEGLDNAAHELALKLLCINTSTDSETVFPWNMEIIGAILENVQEILAEHGHLGCWPYHEDEVPCYQTDTCQKKDCPLKGCQ